MNIVLLRDFEGKEVFINPVNISYIVTYIPDIDNSRYEGLTKVSIMGMSQFFFTEPPLDIAILLGYTISSTQ